MKKREILKDIKILAKRAETVQVRSFLNLTIKILEMSPRRIEGFVSLIRGFSDQEIHKASSENKGIHYRKKRKI